MQRKIVKLEQMPHRPRARKGSARYEITLECGHITWRPASELVHGGKPVEALLCRACEAQAKQVLEVARTNA